MKSEVVKLGVCGHSKEASVKKSRGLGRVEGQTGQSQGQSS